MRWQILKRAREELRFLYNYSRLRRPKHRGWLPSDEKALLQSLKESGIPVQDVSISVPDYRDYFDKAGYVSRHPHYYPWNITEKSLEHFIAQEYLGLDATDVYVDIASEGSPVPEIYQRLYGCTTYAQDLTYEPGLHGPRIGSDAASLPLPDASLTKLALHCSFEHFEGDADSGFIREAARLLRVGGKLVIVPLYLSSPYTILTDPLAWGTNHVGFERDAIVTAVRGWGNRHGRFYDPAHLVSRVLSASKDLTFSLFRVVNAKDLDSSVYVRFVLLATRINTDTI